MQSRILVKTERCSLVIFLFVLLLHGCASIRKGSEVIQSDKKSSNKTEVLNVRYQNTIEFKLDDESLERVFLNDSVDNQFIHKELRNKLSKIVGFSEVKFGGQKIPNSSELLIQHGTVLRDSRNHYLYGFFSALTLFILPFRSDPVEYYVKAVLVDENKNIVKNIVLREEYYTWYSLFLLPVGLFMNPYETEKKISRDLFSKLKHELECP